MTVNSILYFKHNTAIVDEGAQIGPDVKIWHFSHVMPGAVVGEGSVLGQNVYLGGRSVVGKGCRIQNNVSLYDDVILEDGVFCGPSCVFTNVINPRAFVERKSEFRQTVVKTGASIGANATIICGITLGKLCFVGAGSVVTRDVPDHALVYGSPAHIHGWVCRCGEKLDEKFFCPSCSKGYSRDDKGLRAL